MEYSIKALADLAGITTRALRYYHQIGLFLPKEINSSGYRVYGQEEVDRLQQILFFREMGMELNIIRNLMEAPDFDRLKALEKHVAQLRQKKQQIQQLICNADKTIARLKGEIVMSDQEKFEGFKQELTDNNEKQYGAEIREKYGDAPVDEANAGMMKMTQEQYGDWKALEQEIRKILTELVSQEVPPDPAGEKAQHVCQLHKQWLMLTGAPYSKEYHRNLALMYGEDPRFTAYYDKDVPGCAAYFKDAIDVYCK